MNADDFLSLALKLSRASGEAEKRTAVSRAYYGAFHCAKQLVEDCGVNFGPRGRPEVHREVLMCLTSSGDSTVAAAATKLGTFRGIRNDADYDLQATKFNDPKLIQVSLAMAKEISGAMLAAKVDAITPQVRAKASILGLMLR